MKILWVLSMVLFVLIGLTGCEKEESTSSNAQTREPFKARSFSEICKNPRKEDKLALDRISQAANLRHITHKKSEHFLDQSGYLFKADEKTCLQLQAKAATLKKLDLGEVSDLSLLRSIRQLEELEVTLTSKKDIAYLSRITSLKYLKFETAYMEIETLDHFVGLKNLETLILNLNRIQNLDNITYFPKLKHFEFEANKPVHYEYNPDYLLDITPLKSLSLLKHLNLRNNNIEHIESLSSLKHLEFLNLSINHIKDIHSLKGLEKLKFLNLAVNRIDDIVALKGLVNMKELDLAVNNISGLDAIENMTRLEKLIASQNPIQSIFPTKKLTNLLYLELKSAKIEDISLTSNLINLEYLNFSNNYISNVSPLKKLIKLREIWLYNNKIKDIKPIVELKNLEHLILDENEIHRLPSLKGLKAIKTFALNNNRLTDATPLFDLPENSHKPIRGNPIEGLAGYDPEDRVIDENTCTVVKVLEGKCSKEEYLLQKLERDKKRKKK